MTLGRRHFYLLFALGFLLIRPLSIPAQEKEAKIEKARFTTPDGVELIGSFYPSAKKNAPVAIMLHAIGVGQNSKNKEWLSLAEALQKSGLAVLTFDFRGHGQSTEVTLPDMFWAMPANARNVKSSVKTNIEVKNFDKSYYPILLNDIAAARAYLERNKNDKGECSTSNIILIGAETGATLGAAWMNTEWYRHKVTPPAMVGMQAQVDARVEGKDVIAGIWLSITPELGSRKVRLTSLLDQAVRVNATPMVFMCSDGDVKGREVARGCEKALKVAKSEKHRYIAKVELEKSKLVGAGLLQESLGSEKAIVNYLKDVVEDKSNEWSEREFRKNQYIWLFPAMAMAPQTFMIAKPAGENNFNFDNYGTFGDRPWSMLFP